MPRLLPVLGLGLLVGVLYWQRRQRGASASDSMAGSATSHSAAAGPPAQSANPAPPRADGEAVVAALRRIKGNVHGERQLYHLPEDDSYDQVHEERLFATVE